MTDLQYEEQKQRVENVLEKFIKPLGFAWWDVGVVFERQPSLDDTDNKEVQGTCQSFWQYRSATLTFYLASLSGVNDRDLEDMVIHELCHILVAPVEDYSSPDKQDKTELATTNVAFALRFAYEEGKRLGREELLAKQNTKPETPKKAK